MSFLHLDDGVQQLKPLSSKPPYFVPAPGNCPELTLMVFEGEAPDSLFGFKHRTTHCRRRKSGFAILKITFCGEEQGSECRQGCFTKRRFSSVLFVVNCGY